MEAKEGYLQVVFSEKLGEITPKVVDNLARTQRFLLTKMAYEKDMMIDWNSIYITVQDDVDSGRGRGLGIDVTFRWEKRKMDENRYNQFESILKSRDVLSYLYKGIMDLRELSLI